jgi:hypothetical protein
MAIRSELTLGIRNFQTNLTRATQEVRTQSTTMRRESAGVGEAMSSSMGGAAASIATRLAPIVSVMGAMNQMRSSLKWADDLADLTEKLNDNAESLQRVDFAAQQAASIGVSQVADSMLRLERSLGDVENQRVAQSLEGLGVSVRELQSMSLDEKVLALADAFQAARATGTGLHDLQTLMGRTSSDLIPLFNRSGEELRAMFEGAPQIADETVQAMAEMNDQMEAFSLQVHGFVARSVGAFQEFMRMKADLVMTGSFDEMASRSAQRQDRRVDRTASRDRERIANAEGAAARREEAAAEQERERAMRESASAAEELARAMEAIAKMDLDLMPEPQQIETLAAQLETLLDETVASIAPSFDTSVEGLRALAEARLAQGDALPESGAGSAAEAFRWLEEAMRLAAEIAKREASAQDREAQQLADRERARERAEAAEFRLMDPEEQMERLRDRLSNALGFGVGMDFSDDEARRRIAALREAGEFDEAAEMASTLMDARSLAERMDDGSAPVSGGEQGSFASLMDQIFGRGVPEQQLDRLREIETSSRYQGRRLDRILKKMDETPDPDIFTNYGV